MNPDAMVITLKSMKLHGMADAVGELSAQSSPAYQQAVPVLEMLLKAEASERDVRSINHQMKVAKFPAYRDLTGFDFSQSLVDEALVKSTKARKQSPLYFAKLSSNVVSDLLPVQLFVRVTEECQGVHSSMALLL